MKRKIFPNIIYIGVKLTNQNGCRRGKICNKRTPKIGIKDFMNEGDITLKKVYLSLNKKNRRSELN
jgi:hypothetical protein